MSRNPPEFWSGMTSSLRLKSRPVRTFRSYVDLGLNDTPSSVYGSDDEVYLPQKVEVDLKPNLVKGEVIIAQAKNVLKFNTFSDQKTGISGALFCTNFKLSFVTMEQYPSNKHQRNQLLGENDICLINIGSIYQVFPGRRRKLIPGSRVNSQLEVIEVHCKDFRTYSFSFKFSLEGHDKAVLNALLHHAFAPRIRLLFAFECKEPVTGQATQPPSSFGFCTPDNWISELQRCNCPGWRVTQVNEEFQVCESLPICFVVPSSLLDAHLIKAAPHFCGHRLLNWRWSLPAGPSLIRVANADPSISDSHQFSVMQHAVKLSHPKGTPLKIINVDIECAGIKDIQASYLKLQELCMPTSGNEFWEQDSHYLSSLENSRWLHIISAFLDTALDAARSLWHDKNVVILQEGEDRDLNCVISSLMQLLLDPLYRTLDGFQTLIQKEWVSAGHPFTERLALVRGCEAEECPVFLLFLDCVWQLQRQFPSSFEFCETYLTTLWDSAHISLFDTFLFSSQQQRCNALKGDNPLQLRSVWNWSRQFLLQDIYLFRNPLYILSRGMQVVAPPRPKSVGDSLEPRKPRRRPATPRHQNEESSFQDLFRLDTTIKALQLWTQCYLRWIPLAQVVGGGTPIVYLHNAAVVEEIHSLEAHIEALTLKSFKQQSYGHRRIASDDYGFSAQVSMCELHPNSHVVTSAFPFSPVGPLDWRTFSAVPSSSCLQVSFSCSDEELDD